MDDVRASEVRAESQRKLTESLEAHREELARQEAARMEAQARENQHIPEEARANLERWECVRVEARRKELEQQRARLIRQDGFQRYSVKKNDAARPRASEHQNRRRGKPVPAIPNFHRELSQIKPPTRRDSVRPGTIPIPCPAPPRPDLVPQTEQRKKQDLQIQTDATTNRLQDVQQEMKARKASGTALFYDI